MLCSVHRVEIVCLAEVRRIRSSVSEVVTFYSVVTALMSSMQAPGTTASLAAEEMTCYWVAMEMTDLGAALVPID